MPLYSETVRTALAGERVRPSLLFFADFASGPVRFWQGAGPLQAGGHTWAGSGHFITASGLDMSPGPMARSFSITLSGLSSGEFDGYARLFGTDPTEYRFRTAQVFLLFFGPDWQPLDSPVAVATGFMDKPNLFFDAASARVSIKCEGALVRKHRPRFGYYTDADQQRRYPGDKGLEFAPIAATRNVRQPVL